MIDGVKYEEIIKVSNDLKVLVDKLEKIVTQDGPQDIKDFISTVEGYSKYLETLVQMNIDADTALSELKNRLH
jgi:hypothetical protein